MNNPFWVAFRLSNVSGVRVAKEAGISRVLLYDTVDEKGMPGKTRLDTMERIAAALGHRVVITLEPIEKEAKK